METEPVHCVRVIALCSMDDGSSISSGEISDAVAGVSTDDNITVGSSLSAHSSHAERERLASQRAAVLHMGSVTLQTSSARRAGPAAERTTLPLTSSLQTAGGAVFIRRSNQAVVTDLKARTLRSGTAVAIDDPVRCLATATNTSSNSISSTSGVVKQKKDSETNTDNSTLMMLAQRSRVVAEYSAAAASRVGEAQRQRSLTPRRLVSVSEPQTTDAHSSTASSLARSQSDSRSTRHTTELQSSRKPVSDSDDLDDMSYPYYSSGPAQLPSHDKSRCPTDDPAAAAAAYHNDIAYHLSASGGQYTTFTQSVTAQSSIANVRYVG